MEPCFARRLLLVICVCGSLVLSLPSLAGESNDKLTGLALHPGLTFQQEVDSPVCGNAAQMNLYDTPGDASLSEYITWYKQQLKGFHYVHKVWMDRPQELFYGPEGTTAIGITGLPTGDGVFAVAYMKISSKLTTHQMDAFSPDNPSCK